MPTTTDTVKHDLAVDERVYWNGPLTSDVAGVQPSEAGTITKLSTLNSHDTGYMVQWDREDGAEFRCERDEISPFTLGDYIKNVAVLRNELAQAESLSPHSPAGVSNPFDDDETASVSAGILDEARATIAGPRQATYGSATDSFTDVGRHWEIILGVPITAAQVAQAMIALKLVRLGQSPTHRDSWVDIAGYSGLGAEAAVDGQEAGA